MNLPFSTTWPEKMGDLAREHTHFVEKIWESVVDKVSDSQIDEYFYSDQISDGYPFDYNLVGNVDSKIHTIRKGNRWKPGMMIDFWINYRTKNQFRFAPRIPVVSVQKIEIDHNPIGCDLCVYIDEKPFELKIKNGQWYGQPSEIQLLSNLAQNDGFDSVDHFFRWFSEDFKGQIIHWTNHKY